MPARISSLGLLLSYVFLHQKGAISHEEKIALCLLLSLVLMSTGCADWSRMQKGAVIGAGAGGVAGGLIGHAAGNTAVGVLLGAVIGGAAGAYIWNYMDKRAAKAVLKDQYRGEISIYANEKLKGVAVEKTS